MTIAAPPPSRIFGLVCIRNEASRYLKQCLAWHERFLDDIFVYDDQSTDDSRTIARAFATVELRPDHVPAFLENEGAFRQAAWEAFELQMQPQAGDWVLAFDADEFLVAPSSTDPRYLLETLASGLETVGIVGCKVHIHEVFDVDEQGVLQLRRDGFWGDITGLRFFQYQEGGRFANRKMAPGSAPTYVTPVENCLELLHFGYACKQDRIDKHNRYFGLPGHSAQHIASIIETPVLIPWTGVNPL